MALLNELHDFRPAMLRIVSALAMASCIFFVVLNVRAGFPRIAACELFGFGVLLVNHLSFGRHGRVAPATAVAAVTVVMVIAFGAYQKGAGVLAMYAPLVLVSFYLLGRRGGAAVSVGVVAAVGGWTLAPAPATRGEQPSLHIVLAVMLVAVVGYFYEKLRAEHVSELLRLSTTDPLTGALNRRSCMIIADEGLSRVSEGCPLSVALFDVDHFKSVNDGHGHDAGDAILCEVARRIRASIRGGDALVRWGGEEFLVVLPDADEPAALRVAERIRREVAAQPMGPALHVRISGGVATATAADDLATLIGRADRRLYRAKRFGRNRVCVGDLSGPPPPRHPPLEPVGECKVA